MYHCDLCDIPLKENDCYKHLVTKEIYEKEFKSEREYTDYIEKIQKEIKYICPTCKEVIDLIFKYRRDGLYQLKNELFGICDLETKIPPHEKNKDIDGNQ
jgi:hypothetical protein